MGLRNIAVIDVGKTNAKLALVEAESLTELAVVTRPNTVIPGPPWPHFDLDGHWAFFQRHLAEFHSLHGVDAVSVTTHGASAVLLDADGELAAPMLDYEFTGPDTLANGYDAIRPPFEETGSPRLPMGLNLGAQVHWQFETQPDLADRVAHLLTYPQYWGWRLTGELASDMTSLGCHTDLWNPWLREFSPLVARLGLAGKIAPARKSSDILGRPRADVVKATGLSPDTPILCGIHDSNASLYPHVLGRRAPFAVVSTGTWVVAMAVGSERLALDPARDTLVNVNAFGDPVPSARFMGGREYELVCAGSEAVPDAQDRAAVLREGLMLLPAVEPASGPFRNRKMSWTTHPGTEGRRLVALSFYLALMTRVSLDLIGARGPVIVEGPFGRNPDYLDMLAAISPEGVEIATSATGTSVGAALLCIQNAPPPLTRPVATPADKTQLADYAARWRMQADRISC
ncbi:FGGY-family carbohydrate kinase [Tabrizicola sp. J26]|uniref:FGGY-family carbohydrate kinase n=1 Tax=Alitabrizicola rongguiensis TaxID=2909234 RepID=UPI001F2333CC|nr:FGGY-family carbohydrate kinase [Tabrizicola rongguiensis]MCF1707907.1 FGGY-family carbohydrate kinase [Tabrizicola rongguiensis]